VFIPSLGFLVYHLILSNLTKNMELKPELCLNMCTLNQTELYYCNSLWRHLDTPIVEIKNDWKIPLMHLILISILIGCFILSTFESFMETMFSWTPYRKLYQNTEGFIHPNVPKSSQNPPKEILNQQEEIPLQSTDFVQTSKKNENNPV
jgi:hypothetical protein